MADANYDVGLAVSSKSDTSMLEETRAKLVAIKEALLGESAAHKESEDAARSHGGAIDGLKGKLESMVLGVVSFGAAIKVAWDSFHAAVNAQAELEGLHNVMKVVAKATDAQIESTDKWVESLRKASGMSLPQVTSSMNLLLTATHNVDQAQLLMNISAGAAAQKMGSVESISRTLAMALETGNVRGLGPFQDMLRKVLKNGGSVHDMMGMLITKFGDAGASVNTTEMQMKRLNVAWDEQKEAMGKMTLGLVTQLTPALKFLSHGLGLVIKGWMELVGVVKGAGASIGVYVEAISAAMHGHFSTAKQVLSGMGDAFLETLDKYDIAGTKLVAQIDKSWADTGKAAQLAKDKTEEARRGIEAGMKAHQAVDDSDQKHKDKILAEQKKSQEKAYAEMGQMRERLDDTDHKLSTKELQREEQTLNKLLTLRFINMKDREAILRMADEVTQRRQQAEQADELKRLTVLLEKEKALRAKYSKDAIHADDILSKNKRDRSIGELKTLIANLDKQAEEKGHTVAEMEQLEDDQAEAHRQLQEEEDEEDAAAARTRGERVMNEMVGVFEGTKEGAIASAIVKTWESAQDSYAWGAKSGGPILGAVMAAIAVAQGLMKVAKIESTKIGSKGGGGGSAGGGGSPSSPSAFTSWQASRPAAVAQRTAAPTSVSNTTNFGGARTTVIQGLTSEHAAAMMTDFQRRAQPAQRLAVRNTVGFTPQRGGSSR